MKLGTIPKKEGFAKSRRTVVPPISLERPDKKELGKDQQLTFKLRSNPGVASSPTYDHTVPYYNTGTCEEWVSTLRAILRVADGQNMTNGPARFALARRILLGDALAAFNEAALLHGAETVDTFLETPRAVTAHVFPSDALKQQKRYMRRFMRKPPTMSVRNYVSRVTELNQLLTYFPPNYDAGQLLPGDVIREILEFSVPLRWQQHMIMQGFIPENKTVSQFVEFCERFERTDGMEEDTTTKRCKTTTSDDTRGKNSRSRGKGSSNSKRENSEDSGFKPCPIHGRVHSENRCWDIKRLKKEAAEKADQKTKSTKKRPSEEGHSMEKSDQSAVIDKMVEQKVAAALKKIQLDKEIDAEINAAFNYDTPVKTGSDSEEDGEEQE